MISTERLSRLRARFDDDGGPGAIIITDPTNVAYLTAFDDVFDGEDAHVVAVMRDGASIYTDSRYATVMNRAAEGSPFEVTVVRENLYITMCRDLNDRGITSIALEASIPHGRFRFISREFQGNVEAMDECVEEIRQVKDDEELRRIGAAQELTDAAFAHILPFVKAGVTETDVALELEFYMRRNGSDGVAFAPIVASGPNSAFPHAKVTKRTIERGDFVKMDFGARLEGYCADMTRTVVIGAASSRHREIYDTVLAANLAGIAAVKPGLPGMEIDAAARKVIEAAGFGDLFGHGLGHGVGMEVHESPSVGPRGTKSVREGSVITIEPGIYVPGFGGVRIEDLLVVEEGGCRVFTRSGKDLLEL